MYARDRANSGARLWWTCSIAGVATIDGHTSVDTARRKDRCLEETNKQAEGKLYFSD